MLVRVIGAVGGVGASTFAWCLARALQGYAFDFALRPGGLAWVAAAAEPHTAAWPEFTGADIEATEWLGRAAISDGVRWFSGGSPPAAAAAADLLRSAAAQRPVVSDGHPPVSDQLADRGQLSATRIICATNSLRVWESAADLLADAYFVRLLPGGIPLPQIEAQSSLPVFAVKSEPAVAQAVELGLGVARNARIAKECSGIADWLRTRNG